MIRLPFSVDINNLIDDIRIFSWQAADILLYYSNLLKDSDDKRSILKNNNEDDPVTLADLKVNDLIIRGINEKYKNINWDIISEENAKNSLENFASKNDWIWVLDPLDGTKDFIQGTGNYAMHLALNFRSKPYMGFVLLPDKNQLWIADGEKTWCEKRDGSKQEPILLQKKKLQEMTLVTSKNHGNDVLRNLIQTINFCKVEIMGSIGCKIASLLRGESDIYICLSLPGKSSPKDWDFAAPESILKAAGGEITNLDNQELSYGKNNFNQGGIIVATNNKKTHGNICCEIKKIIERNEIYPL
ncbi:3'(2'),5'-bisphosphate nucleotidase CysQ [Prochlorococcus marinus XMU1410]|uniref:3'(2'),5'-bisphosphate nucleotidase CysQ n=1 Tax=Prochlorococcus marinus TaxID=1219 RepID=UPI001AD95484|nr:3'(2'),5'-bisphosphate nucleotidase CysQ [Prochlorococcus marinus]MBO8242334.1 3'(2'),5'-bisphosphate nucleotidase CysQ [Prochlorococcus marinus XMU1410]MBW3053481.1 3'(2'),5'-bisphosphate nucleotidase CysQ [Prochlorococcus marinus str. MU1410]